MPYFLDNDPSSSEISEALNYLLSNFNTGITSDPNTGQIKGPTGAIVGYLYKYMAVKYADSYDGSVGFSDSPTNKSYFGIRNNDSASESSNYTDYIWNKVTGGFGTTKFLWYVSTGGRQIQFAVSATAPDTGWLIDPTSSIDLDVVTSGTTPVISETFFAYFAPSTLQVPRSGNPLTPNFTGVQAALYATDKGTVVPFTSAQTDSNVGFVNGSWRIGNSATTGYGDISLTNITVGNPTDAGDYALWPAPTAMSNNPAYISVPIRYKNSLGVVTQAAVASIQYLFGDPGPTGSTGASGPSIDISGYTSFVQNAGGAYTPTSATLSAVISNITSPTYSWAISGATPTSATTSSVVVTPTSSSTGVTVTLTINGSNLLSPTSKTIVMPVVYNGAAGQAGANGVMSAFPTIYIWTGSSTPPTRPTTTSTYTWATGAYTAPSGWSTSAPSNTTAGNYLWSITYPITASATTTTSTLYWSDTANAIRAIAYNGTDGGPGSNGAGTYVITRTANDSSAPTNSEVSALLGRTPVAGDICTVSYNNQNNAVIYRYITSWTLFVTYITGSLIVQNTITGDKIAANTITGTQIAANTVTASNINSNNLTIKDGSGNILFGAGTNLAAANIVPASGWLNSNVTIGESSGVITLGGAGSGSVTAVTANNKITSTNVGTYMASAAISTAYIGDAQITNAKIGTAAVNTLTIAGQAVTVPTATSSTSSSTSLTHTFTASGSAVVINVGMVFHPGVYQDGDGNYRTDSATVELKKGTTTLISVLYPADFLGALFVIPNPTFTFAMPFLDTPSAGSVSYVLSVTGGVYASTYPPSCEYKVINTLEVKR